MFHPIPDDLQRQCLCESSNERNDIRVLQPLPHNNFSVKLLQIPIRVLQRRFPRISDERADLPLNVRPESRDVDLFPIEFRFLRVSGASCRIRVPSIPKTSARNEGRSWEDLTVATCALQSA